MRSARRLPFSRFFVKTYALRPRCESFARRTASSSRRDLLDRDDRAEDLLASSPSSSWSQPASTVGSKNCPRPGAALAAGHERARPSATRVGDVLLGDLDLLREDDRADVDDVRRSDRPGAARASSSRRARRARRGSPVRVDALDRDADLTGVREAAEHDGARGALDVAVGAGDERRLAAELHHARDEALAARRGDALAGRDAAGEDELLDARLDERRPVSARSRRRRRRDPRGGRSASKISFAFCSMSGVTSLGLMTTALPATSAMTTSPIGMTNGKFHGEMTPTTPRGT